MRVLTLDYSGHPFQVQLSRELARRGHQVTHLYSGDFQTPKGALDRRLGDPDNFEIVRLSLGKAVQKASFFKRRAHDQAFGRRLAAEILERKPDVVLSCNAPIDGLVHFLPAARQAKAGFVFWVQDLYGEAISRIVAQRLPGIGPLIGWHYKRLEYGLIRSSDLAIVISDDFTPLLHARGIPLDKIVAIENWAPLEEVSYVPPQVQNGPARFIYSGTLGHKHNPDILIKLAQMPNTQVIVYSEGWAADELRQKAENQNLKTISVRPWVKFEDLPRVLSEGDVLLAMIEADAGVYSVPSKVLTYLCVGRPVLAAIPAENLAAKILTRELAGLVCSPGDVGGFLANASKLAQDPQLRLAIGEAGRAYAKRAFKIERLGDQFEQLLQGVVERKTPCQGIASHRML